MTPLEHSINLAYGLLAPPPRLNVAQWAELYRELPRGTTAEPGKWHNDRLPYLTEIMESFTDPEVTETVMCMGKQLGKTSCMENAIGYVIDFAPANILFKGPSLDNVKRFSKMKLMTFIYAMPRLRAKIRHHRSRDSGNTTFHKLFPGGSISLVGANSAAGLRQVSCQWVIQDEIDSDQVNTEGDPVAQADGRAENFTDAVFIKASTPTIKGTSRIWNLYEDSDQRQWHVSCPRCSHLQVLKWSNVRWSWPDGDGKLISEPEKAVYVCDSCQGELSDFERVRMVMGGRWIPKFPHRLRRGYHLSGLYRIMGKKKKLKSYLHEFVVGFLNAKRGGPDQMQFWINTFLAEPYEIQLDKISSDPIYLRRESYGPELPKGCLVLTCAVDTQADRLEYLIKGWGLGEESWAIETGRIMGNPFRVEVWKSLDAILGRPLRHPVLGEMRPVVTVIDSGGQADDQGFADPVYRFVRPRQPTEYGPGVYAIKGSSKNGAPLVSNRRPKKGICLKIIGVSNAKLTVHARLKLEDHGPRFLHYPHGFGFDEEFFAQLAAEAPRTVKRKGYQVLEWHKLRTRNEALDMEVYSLAALEILNADLPAIAAKVRAKTAEPKPEEPAKPDQSPRFVRRKVPRLVRPKFRERFRGI